MNQEVYNELVEKANEQQQKMEQDIPVNLCANKYLNCALDCMEYMDHNYSIDLDCSDISLEVIDILLENAHEAVKEDAFEQKDAFVTMIAGYVGITFQRAFGGEFVYDEEGEALNINTNHLHLVEVIDQCIQENKKITEYFAMVKENL